MARVMAMGGPITEMATTKTPVAVAVEDQEAVLEVAHKTVVPIVGLLVGTARPALEATAMELVIAATRAARARVRATTRVTAKVTTRVSTSSRRAVITVVVDTATATVIMLLGVTGRTTINVLVKTTPTTGMFLTNTVAGAGSAMALQAVTTA